MNLDHRSSLNQMPTIFFLHYLGGSGHEWQDVIERLGDKFECVTIDLAGFGNSAGARGFTVAEMVESLAGIVRHTAPPQWFLVGHSMGAKVVAALARRAEDDESLLQGLTGLVLIAGSPPSPEPMDESQRDTMKSWFRGDAANSAREAQHYIDQNISNKLDADKNDRAVADVLRANLDAWIAWLDSGSREDWSKQIGVIKTPTLLIAGSEDKNLGPDAQRQYMAPHFANVNLVTLPNAKHLLPLEYPGDVAKMIKDHASTTTGVSNSQNALTTRYRALIESRRVGTRTRDALLNRLQPDDAAYEPIALSLTSLATLRAVLARMLPQKEAAFIDIAARIDAELGSKNGDGWRRAELPADAAAYNIGLLVLDEQAKALRGKLFVDLDGADQDEVLSHIVNGPHAALDLSLLPGYFNAAQMALWFADLRSDAVQIYVSHPVTLDKMGYSGIANGGDGMPKTGFVKVGLDEKEDWEPPAHPDAAA